MRTQFCIYGEPRGKERPKFSTVCGHVTARTPENTVLYENLVKTEYRIHFDNIGKIICDALNGIAYRDDAQIVDALVRKFYSDTPRVIVEISDIPYEQ